MSTRPHLLLSWTLRRVSRPLLPFPCVRCHIGFRQPRAAVNSVSSPSIGTHAGYRSPRSQPEVPGPSRWRPSSTIPCPFAPNGSSLKGLGISRGEIARVTTGIRLNRRTHKDFSCVRPHELPPWTGARARGTVALPLPQTAPCGGAGAVAQDPANCGQGRPGLGGDDEGRVRTSGRADEEAARQSQGRRLHVLPEAGVRSGDAGAFAGVGEGRAELAELTHR
jgi:hypothetical protein